MGDDWTPRAARNYSWPDATPGNFIAATHGARSPRIVSAKSDEIFAHLVAECPWLADERFNDEVERYLRSAAIEILLSEHIINIAATKGVSDVASRVFEQRTAAARLASQQGERLGLSPLGYAKLREAVGGAAQAEAGLAALEARGQASLDRFRERQAAVAARESVDNA